MVFVFHYGGGLQSTNWAIRLIGRVTQTGWTGVILFFALSGFLITGSLWDSLGTRHVLQHFYVRRALRILPLYFFGLVLTALVGFAHGYTFSELHPLAIYMVFLQNTPPLAARAEAFASPLPLYHLWSLAVEEQFYLLWPALVLFSRTRSLALWLSLAIFAISAVFRLVVWGAPLPAAVAGIVLNHFLLTHAGALALGAALALAIRGSKAEAIAHYAPAACIAGLLLYGCAGWLCGSYKLEPPAQFMLGLLGVSVAAVAMVQLVLLPGFAGGLFTVAPLRWMGRISYGFYVFHILLGPLFDKIATLLQPHADHSIFYVVRFFVAFCVTLLVSWLSFRFFEAPILALKSRFPMHSPLP